MSPLQSARIPIARPSDYKLFHPANNNTDENVVEGFLASFPMHRTKDNVNPIHTHTTRNNLANKFCFVVSGACAYGNTLSVLYGG